MKVHWRYLPGMREDLRDSCHYSVIQKKRTTQDRLLDMGYDRRNPGQASFLTKGRGAYVHLRLREFSRIQRICQKPFVRY
jgi:hypothetical protein